GGTTQEDIEREMRKRDERDSTRTDSPLRAAPDAVTIDTENKSIEEVLDEAYQLVRRVQEAEKGE
ncbi:MAG: (d)CMP kinase, partial [Armatimonadetes bacterium]|nr:(d)CMP kinase [Armatimonadota bacterium]NIM24208.1 (d)CMP kinase [Armatimonadota bacterium]NIM68077.1 (d)CMP kinase [Armatimonadota bacterium]NIM76539.1 (d)CMP kinase [Armatimonadota bacterium]NIN06282.1 (d)CMP kinase [Armatimonadota bacterium]